MYVYLPVCLSVCLSIWQSAEGTVHTEAVILTGQVPTKCLASHIYVFAAMTNLPFVWLVLLPTFDLYPPNPTEPVFVNVYGAPGIDSKEWIPPVWRAGTITLFLLGFLAPIDCLKFPAQISKTLSEVSLYCTVYVMLFQNNTKILRSLGKNSQ